LAAMFVVLSAPADGDPHPRTSPITVRRVHWEVLAGPGHWILNGPHVDDIPDGPEENSGSSESNILPENYFGAKSLKKVLDTHTPKDISDAKQECTRVWANPHGRLAYSP
jgi:hypothetical protein